MPRNIVLEGLRRFSESHESFLGSAAGVVSQVPDTEQGRMILSNVFPNEFEYYMMAFELIELGGRKVTDRLVLPIMPRSIKISQSMATSIEKTLGGVVVNKTDTFVPITISMDGTFGRSFKYLIGNKESFQSKGLGKVRELFRQPFLPTVKTGYGVMKLLERLLLKSQTLYNGQTPYMLVWYNMTFNQTLIVELNDFDVMQDEGNNNMMWRYSLNMTVIGDALEGVISPVKNVTLGSMKNASNELGNLVRDINRMI